MSIRKRADRAYSAHLQGTLDLLILRTLHLGPQHGQGIARAIQQPVGRRADRRSRLALSGAAAPRGARLHRREVGRVRNNRKARFYALTPKGRKELTREQSEWRRIASAIMRVLGPETP